jgi:hypothetical protein
LALHEDPLAIGIDFDGPDGDMPKEDVGKEPAASTCK